MMELEEQERKENIEIQQEDIMRQIAAATGTPAQHLSALNKRISNTPTASLADSRNQRC
jgi:hypothetical protein